MIIPDITRLMKGFPEILEGYSLKDGTCSQEAIELGLHSLFDLSLISWISVENLETD